MSRKKKPASDENNREETQGDWAVEGPHGSSLSVGDDSMPPVLQSLPEYSNRNLDRKYLESLFRDISFPADKKSITSFLVSKEYDVPISGLGISAFVQTLDSSRFETREQLIEAVETELGGKVSGY